MVWSSCISSTRRRSCRFGSRWRRFRLDSFFALFWTHCVIGHHYISIDKTHASQFLIANSIVSCYIVVLRLWKVSKRCVGLYKCCLKLFFIPLLVAICIGFGLLADFHSIGCLHPFVASYTSQVGMMPLNHTSVILNYDLC